MEIWRDIKGYEGLYQVSNYGRVKSLNYKRTNKEKNMVLTKLNSGHLEVRFCKEGIVRHFFIHRLVAEAFIPNPNNYGVVHHIDHNPQNNVVENLEWMSEEEHKKIHHSSNGGNAGRSCKTVYQYTLDGKLVAVWKSASEAARQLGFQESQISNCCNGGFFYKKKKKWINIKQHKGYIWSYVPL